MAPRKQKPALFELIKENKVSTPEWFYGKKRKVEQIRQENQVVEKQENVVRSDKPVKTSHDDTNVPFADDSCATAPWITMAEKRINFSLPLWACAVAALGVVLMLLITYRLGQPPAATITDSGNSPYSNSPPSERLNNLANQPPRNDLLPPEASEPPSPGANPPAASSNTPPVRNNTNRPAPPPSNADTANYPQSGATLIICQNAQKIVLQPVQQFFARNGVITHIGRFSGNWALITHETMDNISTPEAERFKEEIQSIGKKYEQQRSANEPGFAKAFETMWWKNVESIDF